MPDVHRDGFSKGYGSDFDVRMFSEGVGQGDPDVDTSAFQAAIDEARRDSGGPFDVGGFGGWMRGVYVPAGVYHCRELTIADTVMIHGDNVNSSEIRYAGAGGSGSYLFRITKGTAASNPASTYSAGGFQFLKLHGWNADSIGENGIVEDIIEFDDYTGQDWGVTYDWLILRMCSGDAIHFSNANNGSTQGNGFVNCHMSNLRFDAIKGFCVHIHGNNFLENRPLSISRFTAHQGQFDYVSAFETAAVNAGLYTTGSPGSRWGKGFLGLTDARAINVHLFDGRLENVGNDSSPLELTDGVSHDILNVNTGSPTVDGGPTIMAHNVIGYSNAGDHHVFVYDQADNASAIINRCVTGFTQPLFRTPTAAYGVGQRGYFTHFRNGEQGTGLVVQGHRIEFDDDPSNGSNAYFLSDGDLILRETRNGTIGTNLGWVVVGTPGEIYCASTTVQATGDISVGSETFALDTASDLRKFPVGMMITIVGAGDGGANLDVQVTAADGDAGTLTVSPAASTTVSGANVTYVAPTLEETPGPDFTSRFMTQTNASGPEFTMTASSTSQDGTQRAHFKMRDGYNDGWNLSYNGDSAASGDGGTFTLRSVINDTEASQNLIECWNNDGRVKIGSASNYGLLGIPSYDVDSLPNNSNGALNGDRFLAAVSNGDSGAACLALFVGAGGGGKWYRISVGAEVSKV